MIGFDFQIFIFALFFGSGRRNGAELKILASLPFLRFQLR